MYLGSAFLPIISIFSFRRISKLRSINPPEGFDSHPGHHSFQCSVERLRDLVGRTVAAVTMGDAPLRGKKLQEPAISQTLNFFESLFFIDKHRISRV